MRNPDTPEVVDMDTLVMGPPLNDEEAAQVLANLPPVPDADEITVVTSVRMRTGLLRDLKAYAKAHNTSVSELVTAWAERELADDDKVVRLSDVLRALALTRDARAA